MAINACQLERDLQSHGIDLKKWGEVRETLLQLLVAELNDGDSKLEIGPDGLVRVVQAIRLIIRPQIPVDLQKGQGYHQDQFPYLMEVRRVYPGNIVCESIRGPTGKIKIGEPVIDCLQRELREEFGFQPPDYSFKFIAAEAPFKAESKLYPGLLTRYQFEVFLVLLTAAAAAKISEGFTGNDHGVIVTFGWETATGLAARRSPF